MEHAGVRSRVGGVATPRRLLDEAIRVIEADGESDLRLRDIAAACGVTTPIIYKAFGNREGLIVAAQAERFRRVLDQNTAPFAAAIESAATVDELKAVIARLLDAIAQPPRAEARRLQIAVLGAGVDRPALRAAVDDALRSLIDRAATALDRARRRGLVREDLAPAETAWWFFGQVQGRLLIEQSAAAVDADAWDVTARRAVFAVLFTDPVPPRDPDRRRPAGGGGKTASEGTQPRPLMPDGSPRR